MKRIRSGKYLYRGYEVTNLGYHPPDRCVWWEAVDEVTKEASFHATTKWEIKMMIDEWMEECFQKNKDVKMGININDKDEPWTEMILRRSKTVETRNSNSLDPYIGKRVGIIQTGVFPGMAWLVGYMEIGSPIVYKSENHFRMDEFRHKVKCGSLWDIKEGGIKYGYPVHNVDVIEPIRVFSKGIVARNIENILGEIKSVN
jgi:hypothetical protein